MARPDLGKKMNYVVDFWADGCDGPLTVYMQAAYPALMHAALSYYCPDPVNIFTGWARPVGLPKGVRSGSHARGARSAAKSRGFWSRFRKAFGFQPDEWLAKRLPFADDMAGRQVPNGVHWMWSGYGAIERFNHFMFMYSLAEDLLYEFSAGVARSEYCQNQQASVFQGYSKDGAHFGVLGRTASTPEEIQKIRRCSSIGNNVRPHTSTFSAAFSCGHIKRRDGDPDTSMCNLDVVFLPSGTRHSIGIPPANQKAMVYGLTAHDTSVAFELSGPQSFWAYDLQYSVWGRPDVPVIRPAGWCNDLVNTAINWSDAR